VLKGGVKVCKRPLVNEVLGLLLAEFFPDPTHKGATGMADGGSGDADTSNSGSTWAASEANLRDHAVRLRTRRWRYCLRRSSDGYDKASSSNQPDHSYPPFKELFPSGE